MVEIGKFEFVNSNWSNKKGIVVSDREKVEIKVYDPDVKLEEERLHTIMYKNNGGNSVKIKDNNNNKFWSKLKSMWS